MTYIIRNKRGRVTYYLFQIEASGCYLDAIRPNNDGCGIRRKDLIESAVLSCHANHKGTIAYHPETGKILLKEKRK